ncbi:MAG TPA: PQQ-binding-like beta-propeller repeat protein [Gemmata sp.]|nr:PQQ-binding-like beta-propeller repeat protein [Gemmata sp.]
MFRLILVPCLGVALTVGFASAADWPQWRGPGRDGISKETGLLQDWPKEGPPIRWERKDIGTGYSTPVVAGGRVYVQTTRDKEEFALRLDERTGKDLWKTHIGAVGINRGLPYPGTRSSPTVDGDRLYCLASAGELVCLGTDGTVKWKKDLVKDLGGTVGTNQMSWAYSESVLVDGDMVICTPGGKEAGLAALNKMTGEVVWKCELPASEGAEYSSIVPLTSSGVKQYVNFLRKELVGVDAKTGKLLWQYSKVVDPGANIMTPVVYQDKVFASTSRGGSALLELKGDAGKIEPKEVFFQKGLGTSIGGAVLIDGHLYGATTQGLFCAEFATGKEKWVEKSTGNGSICYADGRLYVRSHSTGDVFLVEANPKEYLPHGHFKQPDRSKVAAWPHPIVANGGLYLRDQDVLVCFEVKK